MTTAQLGLIPFFAPPRVELGPFTLYGFGLMVACAILMGSYMSKRRAQHYGLSPDLMGDLLYATFIGGFIGAHLVDVLVYRPQALLRDPLLLFKVWDGISSFGGFFGALAGILLFFQIKEVPRAERWGYCESIIYSLPFGWVFGRIGCFLAHDHPGVQSDFFLAVEAPPPSYLEAHPGHLPPHPFLDLGLLEMLYTLGICLMLLGLDRKRRRPIGFYLAWVPVIYAPVRFLLDEFRVVDVTYFGLTPGQYASVALFFVAWIVWTRRPRGVYGFGDRALEEGSAAG